MDSPGKIPSSPASVGSTSPTGEKASDTQVVPSGVASGKRPDSTTPKLSKKDIKKAAHTVKKSNEEALRNQLMALKAIPKAWLVREKGFDALRAIIKNAADVAAQIGVEVSVRNQAVEMMKEANGLFDRVCSANDNLPEELKGLMDRSSQLWGAKAQPNENVR